MLKPADGVQGVKDFVLDTVKQAGANPCPPIVLGIGIGGSFDHCATLAKQALLRRWMCPTRTRTTPRWKKELLDAINATGFGPQGFGGATTCLGVAIEQKAHPRSLPAGGRQHQLPRHPPRQLHTVRGRTACNIFYRHHCKNQTLHR